MSEAPTSKDYLEWRRTPDGAKWALWFVAPQGAWEIAQHPERLEIRVAPETAP